LQGYFLDNSDEQGEDMVVPSEGLQKIVVLSDFHFGAEGSALADRDRVENLFEELRRLGKVDKLVLLGDVWDLWRTGLPEAMAAAEIFFQTLGAWEGPEEVILVAGNHDYHLKAFSEEQRQRRDLGFEEEPDSSIVLTGEGMMREAPGTKGLTLRLVYPFLSLTVKGKTVLFMHGHHLDFFSSSFWWLKSAWLARLILGTSQGVTVSDLDRLNKPFFELLTVTARVPEIREGEYRFYRLFRFLARLLRFTSKSGTSPRRYTSIEENTRESRDLLLRLLPGYIPDVFVFGHTHRAGFARIRPGGREVLLANCGCWIEEEEPCSTYLVIDDEVRLRRLGEWEIPMRP
jgi:UDP-2,3-diacylglucosamine pyrophosphatase LpxH